MRMIKVANPRHPGSKPFPSLPQWLSHVLSLVEDQTFSDDIVLQTHFQREHGRKYFVFHDVIKQFRIRAGLKRDYSGPELHLEYLGLPDMSTTRRPSWQPLVEPPNFDFHNTSQIANLFVEFFHRPSCYPLHQSDPRRIQLTYYFDGPLGICTTPGETPVYYAGYIEEVGRDESGKWIVCARGFNELQQEQPVTLILHPGSYNGIKPEKGHWVIYAPDVTPTIVNSIELERFYHLLHK